MDWMALLPQIFQLAVFPLVAALTFFAIKWLKAKELEILDKVDSDMGNKYIAMLFETIRDCVSATTQTYVDSLKKQGKFDAEAQKTAFAMTLSSVLNVLTDDSKEYLNTIYGDLNAFITTKIEAEVKAQK